MRKLHFEFALYDEDKRKVLSFAGAPIAQSEWVSHVPTHSILGEVAGTTVLINRIKILFETETLGAEFTGGEGAEGGR